MACCTSLTPTSLPNGRVGRSYNQSISAICEVGGTSNITLFSGTVPPGLTFTAGTESVPATISGSPTTSGTFTFSLRLTNTGIDPACSSSTVQYTIIISKKKKRRLVAFAMQPCPDEIIFRADVQHPKVSYCNQLYNFYGTDENGLLHYIKATSNLSQRGRIGWTRMIV